MASSVSSVSQVAGADAASAAVPAAPRSREDIERDLELTRRDRNIEVAVGRMFSEAWERAQREEPLSPEDSVKAEAILEGLFSKNSQRLEGINRQLGTLSRGLAETSASEGGAAGSSGAVERVETKEAGTK